MELVDHWLRLFKRSEHNSDSIESQSNLFGLHSSAGFECRAPDEDDRESRCVCLRSRYIAMCALYGGNSGRTYLNNIAIHKNGTNGSYHNVAMYYNGNCCTSHPLLIV